MDSFKLLIVSFVALVFIGCKKIYDFSSGVNTEVMMDSYQGIYGSGDSYPIKNSFYPYGNKLFTEIRYSKDKDYNYLLMLNPTDSTISFECQDGQPRMIQEAKDMEGNWRPIEYWSFSFCGNSYGTYRLKPSQKIYFKIRKYNGPFLTSLRVKYIMNKEMKYSPNYWGMINLNQFIKPEKISPRQFLEQ